MIQRCVNVVQRSFDVVSTSGSDIVSSLSNVEKPTSDFVLFHVGSTLFQRWFTTLKQRWSGVEMLAGLHVNVITQRTLSHILTFTYFSRVKVCFWNFQEDSEYRWFLLIYLDDMLFILTEAAWVRHGGDTFSLNLSN